MKRCEVLSYFTLKKFNELENIVRANENNNTKDGELFAGDTFDCTKEMADYLTGNNDGNLVVVKVIEDIKEEKIEVIIDEDKVKEIVVEKAKNKKHGKR